MAPEICAAVLSPGNTDAQMKHKKALFLAAGAVEFWLCDDDGAMVFHDAHGMLERSRLMPAFPLRIVLD
jgi:Uma2 family endonuclease